MHVMLDLETWGRTPGSDIRSIGAVVFDPTTGTVGYLPQTEGRYNAFYIACNNPPLDHSLWPSENSWEAHYWDEANHTYRKYGLTREPATVQWWKEQSEEAQTAFLNPVDLAEACKRFGNWLYNLVDNDIARINGIRLWANGPHFDEAILAAVYRAVNLPVPWHYRAPRDFRTITEAAGMTSADYVNYGTSHNALDDAIAQAMTVCDAYKRLGLQTK
jgi:hypothetical protein